MLRLPAIALCLCGPFVARAAGLSADVQLAPTHAGLPTLGSVDLAVPARRGQVRLGWALDWGHAPLVVVQRADVVGQVIGERVSLTGGLAAAATNRVWLTLVLAGAAQWAGDEPGLSANGIALADPRIGAHVRLIDGPLTLGTRAAVTVPVGTRDAWLGERAPRLDAGLITSATARSLTVTLDAGGVVRPPVTNPTDVALTVASSARATLGLSLRVADRVDLYAQALSRWTPSSGTVAADATLGAATDVSEAVRLDIGVGMGLRDAPGSGPVRARLAVTWSLPRDTPAPPLPAPRVIAPAPAPDVWRDGEDIRLRDDVVELRHPIAFEVRGSEPLPRSWPDLLALAEYLSAHAEDLPQVLIEAYVSTNGSTRDNHATSVERALRISAALTAAGVPRTRLSYRGMGGLSADHPGEGHQVLLDNVSVPFVTVVLQDAVGTPPATPQDGPTTFEDWLRSRQHTSAQEARP